MITHKSQLQIDIDSIDKSAESAMLAFKAAAFTLNHSYDTLWSLPEDRLLAVLQTMYNGNTLTDVFTQHNTAAAYVNTIIGYEAAKIIAPREIVITDGILSFPIRVEPELEIILEQTLIENPEELPLIEELNQ